MQGLVTWIAKATALIGGLVLLGIVVMTSASIAGRTFGLGEINGTYEILEAGVAFAIFSFLPICQIYGGHATVDVFTSGLRPGALRWLRAFWEVVLAAIIVLLTIRLYGGLERYLGNGETTLFLQFPVWWSYLASFSAACVAAFVSVYCAFARVAEAATGRAVLPAEG